jgi:hypothetical protein
MLESKLAVNLWGATINADGMVAVVAAVLIVSLLVLGNRKRQ